MATVATQLNSGSGFASGEIVTATKLNNLVNTATVTGIVNADIDASAAIAGSKLASGAITDTQLATGAVTGAAGGGKLAASAINSQTVIADALASTDEFLVWDASASALRKVSWNSMQPAGSVLQTIQSVTTALQTITGTIPNDDTIPQSSEGGEVLTATITPSSASNKILIRAVIYGTSTTTDTVSAIALFKDSDTNAIAAGRSFFPPGDGFGRSSVPVIEFLHSPSTTSAITYKIRVGSNSGSFYVNGNTSGSRILGGVQQSSLTLQEIKG